MRNKWNILFNLLLFVVLLSILPVCRSLNSGNIRFDEIDSSGIHYITKAISLRAVERGLRYDLIGRYAHIYFEDIDAFIDLDSIQKITDERVDVYYYYSCGTMCFDGTIVFEGTISRQVGKQEIGYFGCYHTLLEGGPDRIGIGTQVRDVTCFLTDEGRISQVRVDSSEQRSRDTEIVITVTTWEPIVAFDFSTN